MLRTARLTLTPLRAGDHDELLTLWQRPEVREFLFDGETLSAEQVTEIITGSEKDFATDKFGFWAIRETGIDRPLLGTAGLRRLDDGPDLEVVYSLDPGFQGRGLAGEAAAAVVAYGFEVLGLDRVLAEIDEGNAASIAVIERLGLRPFETVPGVLGPMIHYALTNPAHGANTA
ncbi:GNAT family N-acetyltransferase [Nocardia sp. NPDC059240]|uniref:GNAT family N-acetyltransferase n=1 Tax=Nocardia sp. NPDC059240 TaxID=3346786 RepID=UPI00367A4EA5